MPTSIIVMSRPSATEDRVRVAQYISRVGVVYGSMRASELVELLSLAYDPSSTRVLTPRTGRVPTPERVTRFWNQIEGLGFSVEQVERISPLSIDDAARLTGHRRLDPTRLQLLALAVSAYDRSTTVEPPQSTTTTQ